MVHLAHPITTRLQASYLQNGTLKLTTKLTESEARTAFSGEQVKLAGVKYKYKRDINANKH